MVAGKEFSAVLALVEVAKEAFVVGVAAAPPPPAAWVVALPESAPPAAAEEEAEEEEPPTALQSCWVRERTSIRLLVSFFCIESPKNVMGRDIGK